MLLLELPIGVLDDYAVRLSTDAKKAATYLTDAIAVSDLVNIDPDAVVFFRMDPNPTIALLGKYSDLDEEIIRIKVNDFFQAIARFSYVTYKQVEENCRELAARIKEYFPPSRINELHYSPIPRGGSIVLGILSYYLNLDPSQLDKPKSLKTPLVIVDDCALSGARIYELLSKIKNENIFLAHLYSHPELRINVKASEQRVAEIFYAQDLKDYSHELLGENFDLWNKNWGQRVGKSRYWIGQPTHVCFPWNEPDRNIWNPMNQKAEKAWKILPSELCIKNPSTASGRRLPVLIQPEAPGPLMPCDHIIFGDYNNRIWIGNTTTKKIFSLTEVGADIWRSLIRHGKIDAIMADLQEIYDADSVDLNSDIRTFVRHLISQNLVFKMG